MKKFYLKTFAVCAVIFAVVNTAKSQISTAKNLSVQNGPQLVPPSQAYQNYLQMLQNGTWKMITEDGLHGLGGVPDPINYDFTQYFAQKAQQSQQKSMSGNPTPQFASVYDLRSLNLVTPIKSQGTCGSCWTFATMGAVESQWKVLGNPNYDLSENHLNNCHGFSDPACQGGGATMSTAYFTRGDGVVTEANDPYTGTASGCNSSKVPVANIFESREVPDDMNAMKQAIMDHGAMLIWMYWDAANYNTGNFTYYDANSTTTNHVIDVVGWDDNKVTAGGTGAWICRNSWGTVWGDAGYFYASYNDRWIGHGAVYWPSLSTYNSNGKVYYYDKIGAVGQYYAGGGNDYGYGLIKYSSGSNEQITKISTFTTAANEIISFEIYGEFDGTTLSNLLLTSGDLTCDFPGSYFWNITPVNIAKWHDFYIKVKYRTPGVQHRIPIENGGGYFGGGGSPTNPTIETGKCWISADAASWLAIGTGTPYVADLCIKAYTVPGPASMLNCSSPVALNCGQTYNGTTVGANNIVVKYNSNNYNYRGPEVIHTVTTTGTGNLTATLSNLGANDLDVFIIPSCNENNAVVNGDLTATYANAPAGTYYIVVDGYQGAKGTYTLNVNCIGNGPPFADFSASATTVSQGTTVNFTDLSTNTPTGWAWTFQGGTPSASTAQNPSVTYNTGGIYNVSLTATNGFGTNTSTKNGYIKVNASGLAEWTILAFVNGDNDLEQFLISDINEMEKYELPNNINLIVQADRIGGYDNSNGDWTDTRRYFITSDKNTSVINSPRVDNPPLGELDMGDGNVLKDFVNWGVANYPAQRYALIIWNHGNGWKSYQQDTASVKSISSDDTDGGKLYMKEISTSLAAAGTPFSLIGYDACIMGMTEVAYALKTNVTSDAVMVGSQKNEPGDGWAYDLWLNQLRGNPAATPAVLGNYIVGTYQQFYLPTQNTDTTTLSTVAFAKMDSMKLLVNAFVNAHAANPEWSVVGNAVNQTIAVEPKRPNYIDQWQLMDYLATNLVNTASKNAAAAVRNLINTTVLNSKTTNAFASNVKGLSIYFRKVADYEYQDYNATWSNFAGETLWPSFISNYIGATECAGAINLQSGVPYNGTTIGGTNKYNGYCNIGTSYYAANDVTHVITTGATGTISAKLTNLNGQDLDINILSGCPKELCLKNIDNYDSLINQPAGTYYIIVDGYLGAQGTYTLTVNFTPPGAAPVTAFAANQTTVSAGGSVNFTDQSTNVPTSWAWTFNGGTPSSSTVKNPTGIVYNTAGTYDVTLVATNAYGNNTLTKTGYITVNATVVTTNVTNVSCNVGSNGAVELIVAGSNNNSSFTYQWSNGATTQNLNNIPANAYTVTITPSGGGSTITKTATVQQPAAVSATVSKLTQVSCNGGNNGAIEITVSGGTSPYTFGWSNGAGTQNISGLSIGTFTVTVTDSKNCTGTANATINQPSALLISVASQTSATCGLNNGSININVTGGSTPYSYLWSNGANTQNVTGLSGGNYTVTTTDAKACVSNKTITVNQASSLTASVANTTNVSCNGGTNGAVNLNVSGGTTPYSYSWSNGATSQNISNVAAGNYIATVTDASGCAYNVNATVSQPAAMTASVAVKTDVNCNGGSNGTINISVSGGTTPYTYLWSNGATTKDLSGLSAGTYTITVTATGGCTATTSSTIAQPTTISVSLKTATNASCFGGNNGSVQILISGGSSPYSFSWNNGANTKDISSLSAGTYKITVTDAAGCVNNSFTQIVTQPSLLSIAITGQTNVSCYNGSNGTININATGGVTPFTYSWNKNLAGQNQTGLAAGTYNVTVSDNNGCTSTTGATITQPPLLKDSLVVVSNSNGINNVTCNGGSNGGINNTTIGGTTPYTYLWSNGAVTQSLSNIPAGFYTVTVTDSKGCTAVITDAGLVPFAVTVTEPSPVTIAASQTDVYCYGGNNGAIDASVSGGGTPFTYNWSNNAPTEDISNLTAGNYTISVTATGGCLTTKQITIAQPSVLVVSLGSVTDNTSCGSNTGAVNINVSGGKPFYSYLWSNGATTQNLSSVGTGTYVVTVTDANSCTKTLSATVNQPGALSVSSTVTNVSCMSGSNGSIDITPSGGTTPYTFAWSNSATTEDISNLAAGNYTVTVTDNASCVFVLSKAVTQPNQLSISVTNQTNVTCNGGNNGALTVSSSGGTAPFSYVWSNGGTQAQISGLPAQTYIVTATDASGCTTTKSATITQPDALSGLTNSVNVSCNGGSNGSVNVSVNGGTSPYSYMWSTGATTASITGLAVGNYAVTVNDASSCVATASGIVSQPAVLSVVVDSVKNTSCSSNTAGGIFISVSGGTPTYSYNWSNNTSNEDITNSPSGNFSVTVTDIKSCTATNNASVVQPGSPAVTIANTKNASCVGGSNGSIDIDVTGGAAPYSYLWSNSSTTKNVAGLTAGNYSVTVTGNNTCSTVLSGMVISQPTAINVTFANKTDVLCKGANSGSVSVSSTGGTSPYSYIWNNGGTQSAVANLTAGNYSVTVADAAACTATFNTTISEPALLAVSITNQTNATCGNNDGSVTIVANGGVTPYSYLWSNGTQTQNLNTIPAGNYSVTVTDNNACKANTAATITQPGNLGANIVTVNVSCNGSSNGSIDLTANGGTSPYTYKWSTSATTEDLNGLMAGNYSVTITDATACKYVSNTQITQPQLLSASVAQNNVSCSGGNNGSINLTLSGGTTPFAFNWSNGATTQNLSGLTAGNYSVTVTDANSCTKTVNTSVSEPSVFAASVINQNNPSCFGSNDGSISLNVIGGISPYSYLWNNGVTVANPTGLVAGAYTVTVTSTGGCTSTASATLTQPSAMATIVKTQTNVSCNGGNNGVLSIGVSGGVSPYSYAWNNGATSLDINTLSAGNYILTVTDSKGCTVSQNNTITQPAAISATVANSTNVTCNGGSNGSINLSVSGGITPYSFLWTGGSTSQNPTGLLAGSYTVTVTDANGCVKNASATITQPLPVSITISKASPSCNGGNNGSASANANGGSSPFTYLWSNSATTQSISNLAAGNYSVTVTASNGCTGSATSTVTEPTVVAIVVDSTGNTTCGYNDGKAFITVSGGTSPYTYQWSNGATTEDVDAVWVNSGLTAGVYTVTAKDANLCNDTASVTITQNSTLTASIASQTNVSCNGGNNGVVNITVASGVTPYSYTWSNADTTQNISNLTAGSYKVTVRDSADCLYSVTANVSEPDALSSNISVQSNISCSGSSDGELLASANGGTSPYSYNWSSGSTSATATGLSSGNYFVTISDNNGCETNNSANLSDPQIFSANISGKIDANCFNADNGSMSAATTGGTAPFTYSWSNSATTQSISALAPATYDVTVTDAGACTATANGTISEPSDISVSASATDVTTNGGNDGSINLTVGGGNSPYVFNWSNNNNTEDINNLVTGNYSVTVTDANGCSKTSSSTVNQPAGVTYCSGTSSLTAASDTFSDGSAGLKYGNNSNCYWLIQPNGASSVTLTFSSFATQANSDRVKIYDGADTNATSFGSYSGTTLPPVLTSTGGSMLVWFSTNSSVTDLGWDASYSSTVPVSFCSGTTNLTAASGSFDDGSAGNDYAENSNCSWLIQPSGAVSVTLTFPSFETESGYDFVNVYDGNSSSAPLLGSFTGNNLPSSLTSSGGAMFVEFTSDASVNTSGWNADYTSSTTSVTYCSGSTNLTTMTGNFSDGSNANNYGSNSDCSWLIQPSGANNITLSFTSFNTESGSDFVSVYDGADTNATLLGSFSGTANPGTIVSSGGSMFVWFSSDASINAAGWSAYYSGDTTTTGAQCSGLTVLVANTGTFSDGSGGAQYSENSNCKWLIQPTGATYITLNFSEFATESGYDFVYVYEGIDSTGTILGTFTGASLPASVTAIGNSMFVQFISDYTVNSDGWTASYEGFTGSPSYCQMGNVLTADWASFSDGSGPNNYLDNSICSWLIQPPGATSITLWFDAFNTEDGFDYVVVFDGSDNTGDTLMLWMGDTIPPAIASSGGSMYVEFISDVNTNFSGWDAQYIATTGPITPYCSGITDLTAAADTFSDGSGDDVYANNSDCKWLIHPAGANMITLDFTNFSIESGYDYVYVYQGADENGTLVGSFTGSTLPSSVTVLDTAMFVWFVSDGFINDAGWSASYTSSTSTSFCSGTTTLTDSSGTFSDGSGGQNYMENSDCSWLIQPNGASSITLNFSDFATENGYDFVRVYEGTDANGTLLGEYTGSNLPNSITANGGAMFVSFISDTSINDLGWTADYNAQFATADYCSGTTTLTATSDVFNDGSGINNYRDNTNCSWLIQPTGAVAIVLGFDAFNTESGFDYVKVYQGADATAPKVAEFSGSTIPDSITVVNSEIFVEFTSDGSINSDGWDAWYHLSTDTTITPSGCSGTTTLTAPSGSFSDGSGTNNYFDNSDCKWLIQPSGATSITLNFTSFDTEQDFDFVTVYDGATTSDAELGKFSSSSLPPTVTSTGGTMLVYFTSDGSVNYAGWDADYTSDTGSVTCNITTSITGTDATCSGCATGSADLTVSGATTPATYSWSNGATSEDLTNIIAGTYSVTLTDANSCTATDAVTIGEFSGFCSGTTTLTNANDCFSDGSGNNYYMDNSDCKWLIQPNGATSITLTFSSFDVEDTYDYVDVYDGISTSDPLLGSFTGNSLPASITSTGGSMLVHFTSDPSVDSTGWDACYTSNGITCNITTTVVGTDASCNGCSDGSATVTASGGTTPYGYLWSDGQTTATATGLSAGSYSVTVTDNSSCTATGSVTISEPSTCTMTAGATGTDATCNGVCDGSTTVNVSNGTTPYSYVWSDGGTGTNLCAAAYSVTVTDANSCTAIASVTINEPILLSSSVTGTDATCNGCADGSVSVSASGGTSPYSFSWSNGCSSTTCTGLIAGTYSVTVTDDNGCSATGSTTISEPPPTTYCSGTTNLTTPTGSFDDGSGANDYAINSDCKWLIQPTGAQTITLTFSAFETELDYDSVTVYDGATTAAPILGSFSGSTIPNPVTSTGGSMLVHFESDNLVNAVGWAASYTITTDIAEIGEAIIISIFPNPNSGEFTYSFTANNTVQFEAKIVNVIGETVWNDTKNDVTGIYRKQVDIKNLSAGIYFLSISINGENYMQRIMRE